MLWWTLWRLRSKDPKARQRAIQALMPKVMYRKGRNPRAFQALLPVARQDDDVGVREAALRALGRVRGAGAAVEALAAAAREDDHARVRALALQLLGQIDDPEAVESLSALLKNPAGELRRAVAVALRKIGGPGSAAALAEALRKDTDEQVRQIAAGALGSSGDKRFARPLAEALLTDASAPVRQASADALGELADARAASALQRALAVDRVPDVKAGALEKLNGDWVTSPPARDALPELLPLLTKGCPVRSETALKIVERLEQGWRPPAGAGRVVPLLVSLVAHGKDLSAQNAARQALQRLDPGWLQSKAARAAMSELIAALADPSPDVRDSARRLLGQIDASWSRSASAREQLPALLAGLGWEDREADEVEKVLGEIDPEWRTTEAARAAATALLDEIRDNRSTREAAGRALGRLGDPRAVEPLCGVLLRKGEQRWARIQAARALQSFRDPRAVPPLLQALDEDDSELRDAAFGSLASVGDARAVSPLLTTHQAIFSVSGPSISISVNHQGKTDYQKSETVRTAERSIRTLEKILERSAAHAATEDLRRIAGLQNIAWYENRPSCQPEGDSGDIDCSLVKQLARQELIRRGLEA